MPTYQYVCTACAEPTEAVQSFTDAPLTVCPACGGALRKVFSAVGVVFKGSGFYKTDSRKGSDSGSAKAEGGSDGAKADGGKADGGKADGGKAEGGKAEGGKGEGGKADAGRAGGGKGDSGKGGAGGSGPASGGAKAGAGGTGSGGTGSASPSGSGVKTG